MKSNKVSYNPINFGVKVSPQFINAAKGMINSGENKLKNNYRFDRKVEAYDKFGYDDYTICLYKKQDRFCSAYILSAVDNTNKDNRFFLAKTSSFRAAVQKFLNINHSYFNNSMKKKIKIKDKNF